MKTKKQYQKEYFDGTKYEHGTYKLLPISLVVPNNFNPNEMTVEEFNLLDASIEEYDCLEPIIVVPDYENKQFTIIGGEHRWTVMRISDKENIPAIIASPDRVDEVRQMELTGKLNFIKGKPSKEKFQSFVNTYIEKTGIQDPDVLAHRFGMSKTAEFVSILDKVEKTLPSREMKKKFKAVRETIKDVDDLSNILNRLFSTHGDTIPAGYMIFDFGGQEHIWVKVEKEYLNRIKDIASEVGEAGYTFDSFIVSLLMTLPIGKFIEKNKTVLVPVKEKE